MVKKSIREQCKLMPIMKAGDSFIIEAEQNVATHFSTIQGVKIRTNTVLIVEDYGKEPKTIRATRVTIL